MIQLNDKFFRTQFSRAKSIALTEEAKWQRVNPLSPKSDQHQISPCHINAFVKQSGHENYEHDHTR